MRHAIVKSGVVENVVEWDGETAWTPPEGTTLAPLGESPAGPGWTFDGSIFAPPVQPPRVTVKTREEFVFGILSQAERQAIRTSAIADVRDLETLINGREAVHWDSPEFLGAMQILQAAGIMSAERAQQILEME